MHGLNGQYEAPEHPDTRAEEERWAWEKEHQKGCDMDRLAFIRTPEYTQTIPCCSACWFKVWGHEGAQPMYQHKPLAA